MLPSLFFGHEINNGSKRNEIIDKKENQDILLINLKWQNQKSCKISLIS